MIETAVITGATGLIGLALVNQCINSGCEVYAVIRPDSARKYLLPESELIHIIECDISRLNDLPELIDKECDVLYHLAWSHTGKHKNDGIEYQIKNIDFTIEAVRAAKALGCRLFIGAGSQAEYGPLNNDIISPHTPANPRIPYGICKLAAGKLAMIEGKRIGINCVWMRVFSVYGFNDKREAFMESLINKMHYDETIEMTEGIQLWDYLYCDDAARAFFLAGIVSKKSKIYCLGSGQSRPLKEYVAVVAERMGYTKPIGYGKIPYTSESVMKLCADISQISEDIGWTPLISFDEGIKETIRNKSLLEWGANEYEK